MDPRRWWLVAGALALVALPPAVLVLALSRRDVPGTAALVTALAAVTVPVVAGLTWLASRGLGPALVDLARGVARRRPVTALDRVVRRVRWVSLALCVAFGVAWVVGGRGPEPVVVRGAGWNGYFDDERVRSAVAAHGATLQVDSYSGGEQITLAENPDSPYDFYLAPNDAIKDEIVAALGARGVQPLVHAAFSTRMVLATYAPVRAALVADPAHRLARVDADGRALFDVGAFSRDVEQAATGGSPVRWGDVAGFPVSWRAAPVRVTAPSPCYAGGGWAYVGMLADALAARPGAGSDPLSTLPAQLQWSYGGGTALRTRDVVDVWRGQTVPTGPLHFMYEKDALDALATAGPDLPLGRGALLYPDPPVQATHWLITLGARGRTMHDLFTGSDGHSRALRASIAERFPVYSTDPTLRGSYETYLTRHPDLRATVFVAGPRGEPVASAPAPAVDHHTVRRFVGGLNCFATTAAAR